MGLIKKVIEKDMFFGAKTQLINLAILMRKNPTDAEKEMWKVLRKFRKSGFLFRRQHPIKYYIADFYCHRLRLVIEVDGEIHSDEAVQNHDDARSGEMERFGIRVLRFTNKQVLLESGPVIEKINSTLNELMNLHEGTSPSHPGGGGTRGRGR